MYCVLFQIQQHFTFQMCVLHHISFSINEMCKKNPTFLLYQKTIQFCNMLSLCNVILHLNTVKISHSKVTVFGEAVSTLPLLSSLVTMVMDRSPHD